MGAHPWFYVVPYDDDLANALGALRTREFQAGRYNPVQPFPRFPVDPADAPGCGHATVEAARAAAGASGARSILDMLRIANKPDYGAVTPLDQDELEELIGDRRPSAEDILDCEELFESIERGQGVAAVAYEDGKPAQIIFAGYSYD